MSSPGWTYPGVLQGRIVPVNSVPQMSESGSYYAGYYAYSYASQVVYCLGEDTLPFQDRRFNIGDTFLIYQDITVTALHKLIRFSLHMRTPDMPTSRNIIVAGPVDFIGQQLVAPGGGLDPVAPAGLGLIASGDGCAGIRLPDTSLAASRFQKTDRELWMQVSGATDAVNNGFHRISAVPWNQGAVTGGDRVVSEWPDPTQIVQRLADPAVTLRVLGLRWHSYASINWGGGWQQRVDLVESYGHTWYRTDLAINVSKYVGPLSVMFSIYLERLT